MDHMKKRLLPMTLLLAGTLLAGCITTTTGPQPPRESSREAAQINLQLGIGYLRQDNLPAAQEKLEKAIEQDPRLAMAPAALGLVFERLQDTDTPDVAVEIPGTAGTDVVVERQRGVLRQDDDVGDPGVDAVGEREVDDAVLAPKGHGRLGADAREDRESLSLTAGEDHCQRSAHEHDATPPPTLLVLRSRTQARQEPGTER